MGYAVLHLDKAPGNEAPMTAHIERTQMPKNADPERTHLNREFIEFPQGVRDRTEAIQHRLDNAGLTRKIGTNQVRAIRVMLTGSPEDMQKIQSDGKLDEWCNDNIKWLRKTYGADNLVSAVLHMDEATPHIHATVVPIVTGERRKAKVKKAPEQPGVRQYRKKNPNAARLCADDVMARDKLTAYQDSYGNAMAKYGLQRGIKGSEARHISTQEFYRNAIAQKGNLQENIELLLQIEHSKRQSVEQLKQKEQEAFARAEQANAEKQLTETELAGKQSELQKVKGELKTQKLKGRAADAGSAILDGLTSALGTPKVKRQEQEIEGLKSENQSLRQDIAGVNQIINRERLKNEKAIGELKTELNKVYEWLPDTPNLIKWGEYCKHIGFSDREARELVNMKPIYFSGELYSKEHHQRFKAEDVEVRLHKSVKNPGAFGLFINGTNIFQWFKQKYDQFLKTIGIKIKDSQHNKGVKL